MIVLLVTAALALAAALGAAPAALSQSAYPGTLGDFSLPTRQGQTAREWDVPSPDSYKQDVRGEYDGGDPALGQKVGEADDLSDGMSSDDAGQARGTGGTGGQPRRGTLAPPPPQEGFPALDPADRNYDPLDMPDLARRVPSSCAEPGSACRQCVESAEENIQFSRRYLHVAWSVTNSHLAYAERMIRFGDAGSGFHGAMALSWQLGGKPEIEAAVAQLRETYKRKYTDYMQNIRRSLDKLAACEQDNFATQDLYRLYSQLYYDMLVVRYEKADP
jgi:hypothetical protein